MKEFQLALAKHSLASLYDTARLLARLGSDVDERTVMEDVATMVNRLCDTLVWSDRSLVAAEYALIDALMQEDAAYGGHLARALTRARENPGPVDEVPRFFREAVAQDDRRGTHLARTLVNSLENLGGVIVGIDGRVSADEWSALDSTISRLRTALAHASV